MHQPAGPPLTPAVLPALCPLAAGVRLGAGGPPWALYDVGSRTTPTCTQPLRHTSTEAPLPLRADAPPHAPWNPTCPWPSGSGTSRSSLSIPVPAPQLSGRAALPFHIQSFIRLPAFPSHIAAAKCRAAAAAAAAAAVVAGSWRSVLTRALSSWPPSDARKRSSQEKSSAWTLTCAARRGGDVALETGTRGVYHRDQACKTLVSYQAAHAVAR